MSLIVLSVAVGIFCLTAGFNSDNDHISAANFMFSGMNFPSDAVGVKMLIGRKRGKHGYFKRFVLLKYVKSTKGNSCENKQREA